MGAGASTSVPELPDHGDVFCDAQGRPPIHPIQSTRMGAGAFAMLPELVDKQQAKAAAGDRFDEAAFDAAAVDGRVPRAVLIEISSWLQTIRDGATELDLTGPTLPAGWPGRRGPGRQPQTWNHALGASAVSGPLPRSRGPFEL